MTTLVNAFQSTSALPLTAVRPLTVAIILKTPIATLTKNNNSNLIIFSGKSLRITKDPTRMIANTDIAVNDAKNPKP